MFVAFACLWREGACTDHKLLSGGIPAHSPAHSFVHLRRAVCREDACFLLLAPFHSRKKIKNCRNKTRGNKEGARERARERARAIMQASGRESKSELCVYRGWCM